MKVVKSLILLMLIFLCSHAQAQRRTYDSTTADVMRELLYYQNLLSDTSHLSFDIAYYMADVDTVTVRDTIAGTYQISGDKFLMLFDSVASIQNDKYFGTIYHDARMIVLQKPVPVQKQILQVDVMDSMFQNLSMAGLAASDSGSYRKIIISFDSTSIYRNYEVVFHKTTSRPLYVKYSTKKELATTSSKKISMEIRFSNYQTGGFDDSVFITKPYFVVISPTDIQSGSSLPVAYEIVNLLENDQ